MSSPDALATVTATLQRLLSDVVSGSDGVTTQPPSLARLSNTAEQLNVFLYGTYYNTAFSNAPIPGEMRNGEQAYPPLPLVLKYIITAYGEDDNDISGQQLMGQAMSVLHDHPVLSRADLEGHADVPNSTLHLQIERIRITPDTLTLDDMSKLWTSFQSAEYRLSTGYEISVVLIDSSRAAKTPLPVLKRGQDDQGVTALADLIPPFPAIREITLPNQQPSALLGNTITIDGDHLEGDTITVHFNHPQLATAIDVPILAGATDNQISVLIPNNPSDWVVGFYTLNVTIIKAGEQDRTTNSLPLPLAPSITINTANPVLDGSSNATISITSSPEIRPEQQAALLLGDREVQAQDHPIASDPLVFEIEDAPVGNRFVRLRVDGIDSHLVDRSVTPPAFNSDMEVTIE